MAFLYTRLPTGQELHLGQAWSNHHTRATIKKLFFFLKKQYLAEVFVFLPLVVLNGYLFYEQMCLCSWHDVVINNPTLCD